MNGQRLRELRKACGKTVREISYESGVTQDTIFRLERGDNPNAALSTLLAICSAIGCSITDIIGKPDAKH